MDSSVIQIDELPVELQELLRAGWLVGPVGSLLLRGQFGSRLGSDWSPRGVAQHEYEVNDVCVPSAGLPQEHDLFLSGAVSRARSFVLQAMSAAQEFDSADLLVAVISVGIEDDYLTHGATVKFFTRRGDYPRYFDDLERFQMEGMAVVEAGDLSHSGPGLLA